MTRAHTDAHTHTWTEQTYLDIFRLAHYWLHVAVETEEKREKKEMKDGKILDHNIPVITGNGCKTSVEIVRIHTCTRTFSFVFDLVL